MSDEDVRREVLPIPDPPNPGTILYDAKDPDATFPPIQPLRPPKGRRLSCWPSSTMPGSARRPRLAALRTPTAERLAADGLKYTRFHTTAICSPTRAALLSGRNHHMVGMGGITEMATSAPGHTSARPETCGHCRTLKLNGYATAHIGKCHEVPVWESSPAGPSTIGRPPRLRVTLRLPRGETDSSTRRCTRASRGWSQGHAG